jgi:pilus assembly protein CpaB
MTYRVRNITLALVLGVIAALLTAFYVTNYKRTVQRSEDSVTVLVAAKDIPLGTSGSAVLEGKLLAPREVARRTVVPGAITSGEEIQQLVATQPIFAGEQVTTRRFRPVEQRGIHGKLDGNVRAIQLPGDPNQVLAGTLKAGDHVDVVGAFKVKRGEDEYTVSRTVLRDIEVLRVSGGGAASSITNGPGESHWVQLAITDSQAAKLWLLKVDGNWTLNLRAVVKSADSPENVETVDTVVKDGVGSRQLERAFGVDLP